MFCNRHRVWCRYRKAYLTSLTRSDFGLSRPPPQNGSKWAKAFEDSNGLHVDGSIERFIENQPLEKRDQLYKGKNSDQGYLINQ